MTSLYFLLLCLIWGSTWMAIKINLTAFAPFYSAGFRFLLAGGVLLLIAVVKRLKFQDSFVNYKPSIIFGILNGVTYGLVYWGEQFISSGLTAILNASLPFFSIIFAALLLDERVNVNKVIGLITGFCGVLFLFYDSQSVFDKGRFMGQLAIVFAAIIYAMAGVLMKKGPRVNPIEAVTIQMFSSAMVLLTAAAIIEEKAVLHFSWNAFGAFLYLALIGSALAFYLYNDLLRKMEVSTVSYISMITPAIATLLGVIILGEALRWQTLAGMALILLGSVALNCKSDRPHKQERNYG